MDHCGHCFKSGRCLLKYLQYCSFPSCRVLEDLLFYIFSFRFVTYQYLDLKYLFISYEELLVDVSLL